ncbi:DUF1569 domain-containing protein [Aquirufa sp. ROCK2-A2]
MRNLMKKLMVIDVHIEEYTIQNKAISDGSVGWHLEHCLIVINEVIEGLSKSDERLYRPVFSLGKWVVLFSGFIPRGKVKAPKGIVPKQEPTLDGLNEKLLLAKSNIQRLNEAKPNQYLTHPMFGHLNTKQVKRFLAIHTEHHLKIVRDILNNS